MDLRSNQQRVIFRTERKVSSILYAATNSVLCTGMRGEWLVEYIRNYKQCRYLLCIGLKGKCPAESTQLPIVMRRTVQSRTRRRVASLNYPPQ